MYGAYDSSYLHSSTPISHTQSPAVTGTSVLAIKFKDGVVIAADNLGTLQTLPTSLALSIIDLSIYPIQIASYGSLARFTDVKRLRPFNNRAIIGVSGDVSDMQHIDRLLNALDIEENYSSSSTTESSTNNNTLNAKNLHTYLSKVMYKRRSEINPLWNAILVAGLDAQGKPFLSSVDLLGTTFSAPTLATGYGSYLAQPLLRKVVEDESEVPNVTREAAEKAVREALKVLFYRDARSLDRFSIAVISRERGVELREDEQLEDQSWAFADRIKGYGTQTN